MEYIININRQPRPEPLEPIAAAATGKTAHDLARRLLGMPDDDLSRLTGVSGAALLIVLGKKTDLPWVDGIVYLGRSSDAAALLLPTNMMPTVPETLFQRAALNHAVGVAAPVAVLFEQQLIASVADARPLSKSRLSNWFKAETT